MVLIVPIITYSCVLRNIFQDGTSSKKEEKIEGPVAQSSSLINPAAPSPLLPTEILSKLNRGDYSISEYYLSFDYPTAGDFSGDASPLVFNVGLSASYAKSDQFKYRQIAIIFKLENKGNFKIYCTDTKGDTRINAIGFTREFELQGKKTVERLGFVYKNPKKKNEWIVNFSPWANSLGGLLTEKDQKRILDYVLSTLNARKAFL